MRRRILSVLFAAALLLGTLPARAAGGDILEEYSDLDRGAWYAPGIRYCLSHGLMNGYGKRVKIFAAERTVSRAQMVTILWRMEGSPVLGLTMQYADVPDGAWYAEAVRWATSAGVMSGYSYLAFGPDDPVTREQLATTLWRYAKYRDGLSAARGAPLDAYADRGAVDDYALEAMRWACGTGIISGQTDRRGNVLLAPKERSTRAAAATILMRFCLDMAIYE